MYFHVSDGHSWLLQPRTFSLFQCLENVLMVCHSCILLNESYNNLGCKRLLEGIWSRPCLICCIGVKRLSNALCSGDDITNLLTFCSLLCKIFAANHSILVFYYFFSVLESCLRDIPKNKASSYSCRCEKQHMFAYGPSARSYGEFFLLLY